MPSTTQKQINESTEEKQIAAIEKNLASLEAKFSHELLREIKVDLTLLSSSVNLVSDTQKRKSVQDRIKLAKDRIGIVEEKFVPSSSKLILFTNKKKDSLEILKDAHQQLAETEKVSEKMLTNLAKQREKIVHSTDALKKVEEKGKQSDGFLDQMAKWWRG